MNLSDLDYNLPKELIAQQPARERDKSNLMIVDRKSNHIEHKKFFQIEEHFNVGDTLVMNSSKVIPARFICFRSTGAKIEALYVETKEGFSHCLLDTPRNLKEEETLYCKTDIKLTLKKKLDYGWLCETNQPMKDVLEKIGMPPLPPYIKRAEGYSKEDTQRYQTVYADVDGSIAAPTAGLHFTQELLSIIKKKGVEIVKILLHVGVGTFKPIKTEMLEEHRMERECYELSEEAVRKISSAARVIAVGTTSARTLESYKLTRQSSGKTDLFIKPGFKFQAIDALVTNFHLPKTTLLALVIAFAGKDLIFRAYQEAIERKYRFYSYGDAMLIL